QTRVRPGWVIAFDRVRAPTSAMSRSPSIAIIAVTMCGRSDSPTVTSVARDPNSPIKRRTSSNATSCGTHASYDPRHDGELTAAGARQLAAALLDAAASHD